MSARLCVYGRALIPCDVTLGSGIFSTPGKVVALVGSPTTAISLWVAGGLLTFCGTFSYIELGTMMPRSGGEQAYLEAAFRRPRALVAFLFCWIMILCIRPGSEAADCIIFAKYVVVPFLGDADHDGFRVGKLPNGVCLWGAPLRPTGRRRSAWRSWRSRRSRWSTWRPPG